MKKLGSFATHDEMKQASTAEFQRMFPEGKTGTPGFNPERSDERPAAMPVRPSPIGTAPAVPPRPEPIPAAPAARPDVVPFQAARKPAPPAAMETMDSNRERYLLHEGGFTRDEVNQMKHNPVREPQHRPFDANDAETMNSDQQRTVRDIRGYADKMSASLKAHKDPREAQRVRERADMMVKSLARYGSPGNMPEDLATEFHHGLKQFADQLRNLKD
jgi:hypothetical protein